MLIIHKKYSKSIKCLFVSTIDEGRGRFEYFRRLRKLTKPSERRCEYSADGRCFGGGGGGGSREGGDSKSVDLHRIV
jgi:hypothetical protein